MLNSEKVEQLSGYICRNCGKNGSVDQVTKITKFPQKLILVLKRFDKDLHKKETKINNLLIGSDKYKLVSIIAHFGSSIKSGHYKAYELIENYQMVTYNDSKVTTQKYKEEQAYILGL